MQFDEGKLADAIDGDQEDGDQEIKPALRGLDLGPCAVWTSAMSIWT